MEEKREQNVFLYSRSKLELTGISDVCEFCESSVEMAVDEGFIGVDGRDLKIEYFSSDSGKVCIHGEICAIVYYSKGVLQKKKKKSRG